METRLNKHACKVFKELRQGGLFCDVTINTGDKSFLVHRNILAACSPFFRALFTNGMKETNLSEVNIPDIAPKIMEAMIDYAYSRELTVTRTNFENLFRAADRFYMNGMLDLCIEFMVSELCPENCLGFLKFSRMFHSNDLVSECKSYVLSHFNEIATGSEADEFLNLTLEELLVILADDDLNVKFEENVFEAIIRWIDYDPTVRVKYIDKLLAQVRMGVVATDYFMTKIKTHPYVKGNQNCRPIVLETMKYLYDLSTYDLFRHLVTKPRRPHEVLFAIGGWCGGSPTNSLETYDTRADRWLIPDTSDEAPRAYHSLAVLDHRIYLIGGFNGTEYFNSVRVFDAVKKTWSEVAPMNNRRCYVSTAVINGCIYAMGGFDGDHRIKSVEKYTPERNQWSMVRSMNHCRSDASAAVLNGYIYIAGGFNGQQCLSSAEKFDPKTGMWYEIQEMRHQRSGVGVAALNGYVYAIGGFNGISRLNTGERYCPENNSWSRMPSMYTHRSNFGIGIMDDMIFIAGGFNGEKTIDRVECFDQKSGKWYEAMEMNVCRSALSVGVVSCLRNRKDYLVQRGEAANNDFTLLNLHNRDRMLQRSLTVEQEQGGLGLPPRYENNEEEYISQHY